MTQEIRVRLDVSLTVNAKHSTERIRKIVEAGARAAWPNNYKHFHGLQFAEERDIYHPEPPTPDRSIRWTDIIPPEP